MPVVFPTLADNPHLGPLLARFGTVAVPRGALPQARMVFLCFTNRCGSNYLAEALHGAGPLNLAGEFLNADAVLDDTRHHGHGSLGDYLAAQMRWRMTGPYFVMKLALPHLEILGRAGVLEEMRAVSDFVHMTRIDRLGQAISYEIARQTGQWTSELRIERYIGDIRFCPASIAGVMQRIEEDNRQFEQFFAANDITATPVVYEKLVQDPAAHVRRIGEAIGLPDLAFAPDRMSLHRQAGALNARWREMYLASERAV